MITIVTTVTGGTMTYGLGILTTIMLIGFLIAKELAGAAVSSGSSGPPPTAASLDRVLDVVVLPLLFVFATIVTDKVIMILR